MRRSRISNSLSPFKHSETNSNHGHMRVSRIRVIPTRHCRRSLQPHPLDELKHERLGDCRRYLTGSFGRIQQPAQVVVQVLEHQRHSGEPSAGRVSIHYNLYEIHDVLCSNVVHDSNAQRVRPFSSHTRRKHVKSRKGTPRRQIDSKKEKKKDEYAFG